MAQVACPSWAGCLVNLYLIRICGNPPGLTWGNFWPRGLASASAPASERGLVVEGLTSSGTPATRLEVSAQQQSRRPCSRDVCLHNLGAALSPPHPHLRAPALCPAACWSPWLPAAVASVLTARLCGRGSRAGPARPLLRFLVAEAWLPGLWGPTPPAGLGSALLSLPPLPFVRPSGPPRPRHVRGQGVSEDDGCLVTHEARFLSFVYLKDSSGKCLCLQIRVYVLLGPRRVRATTTLVRRLDPWRSFYVWRKQLPPSGLFPLCFQLRCALDKTEELEVSNGHLVKRLEKMKANRSALLSQQ